MKSRETFSRSQAEGRVSKCRGRSLVLERIRTPNSTGLRSKKTNRKANAERICIPMPMGKPDTPRYRSKQGKFRRSRPNRKEIEEVARTHRSCVKKISKSVGGAHSPLAVMQGGE